MRWLVLLLLCTGAASAQGHDPGLKAGALRYVFEQWMQDYDVAEGSFVTLYQGRAVGQPLNPNRTVEMASLSKAITAICAAQMIEDGVWSAQTTAAQVLGTGPQGLTLGQLITHSGGVAPDRTQGMRWLLRDMNAPLTQKVATAALTRDLEGQGSYFYNNENYAILGLMITKALQTPYAQACAPRVLHPAGVRTARRSTNMGGTLPWGGWSMSVRDYARFKYHWFGPEGAYGAGAPAAVRFDIGEGRAMAWACSSGPHAAVTTFGTLEHGACRCG